MAVIFFAEFGGFRGRLRQSGTKINLYSLQRKCSPRNLVFSMAIFAEVTEKECIITGTCAVYIHISIMTRLKVSL